jgi:hypothetical protein
MAVVPFKPLHLPFRVFINKSDPGFDFPADKVWKVADMRGLYPQGYAHIRHAQDDKMNVFIGINLDAVFPIQGNVDFLPVIFQIDKYFFRPKIAEIKWDKINALFYIFSQVLLLEGRKGRLPVKQDMAGKRKAGSIFKQRGHYLKTFDVLRIPVLFAGFTHEKQHIA